MIVDLHCHVLPYVDDGALRKEEAYELLRMQYEQGVRVVCATPHLRKGMFETEDEKVIQQFDRLCEYAKKTFPDMQLFLSREYHCDEFLKEKLENGTVIPMGRNHLLIEFSWSHSFDRIREYVDLVLKKGYIPVIAHAERYPALKEKISYVYEIIGSGAKIQINAGSVLGREGIRQKIWCSTLLKKQLVYAVASDAHDPQDRPPEMAKVKHKLEHKVGNVYTEQILYTGPLEILTGTRKL